MLVEQRVECVAGQDADITGTFLRLSFALLAGLTLREERKLFMHKAKKIYGILSYYCDCSSIFVPFIHDRVSRISCDPEPSIAAR